LINQLFIHRRRTLIIAELSLFCRAFHGSRRRYSAADRFRDEIKDGGPSESLMFYNPIADLRLADFSEIPKRR
jgi:hypothetical protein